MVNQIRDSVKRGARGLKVLKDLGLEDRDASGKLIPVNDPRLDPIWEECGRLGIPVTIHSADPIAFFEPIDATNEQYDTLIRNPTWGFSDATKFPTHAELLRQQRDVFMKHPNTTFVAVHVASWPENLDYVSDLLDHCPNVYVDIAARVRELGRQPRRAYKFFLAHQDRILFGTDASPAEGMYRNHFRWLETDDDYFQPAGGLGRWMVYGLGLPDQVLEKVYHQNAEKVMMHFRGADRIGG
jgi:predicted TIM-barrel fold metal-dependent hydrolase